MRTIQTTATNASYQAVSGKLAGMTFGEVIARVETATAVEDGVETAAPQLLAAERRKLESADALRSLLAGHPFRPLLEELAPFGGSPETKSVEAFLEWCALAKCPDRVPTSVRFATSGFAERYLMVLGRLVAEHGRDAVDHAVFGYVELRVAAHAATVARDASLRSVKEAVLATLRRDPHLASIVAGGYVVHSELQAIDEAEADPEAFDEMMDERHDAGLPLRVSSPASIASYLRNEIDCGESGERLLDGRRTYAWTNLSRSVDPIADFKALDPRSVDYWTAGWRKMGERYGMDTTIGKFIEAHG